MFDNYEKFKKDVYALTKIDLNYYKEKQMRRRIDTIATKHGCSNYDEYIRVLKTDKDKFEAFVNFLTINVSEFYRNPDQWKLMDENVIPKLIKQHGKNLHVWSAACSTGDEPYSLVMALSKHIPLCREKYGNTNGKNQELESEPLVKEFFEGMPVSEQKVERIIWLVTHHHTYTNIDGIDYQILIEADFLVNASESNFSKVSIENAKSRIFKTAAGCRLLESIFLREE